jgi:UDP-GlcNAc:undecaprenyl-phosphate GlcNAc-1-phosphate transferase
MSFLLALDAPPGAEVRHLAFFGASLLASALLTALVKPLAVRADLVSRPRNDRWSRTVIPLGGGVAIFLVLAAGLLLVAGEAWRDSLDLVLALGAIFALGLADDRYRLSPPIKLVVQTGAACFLALRGHVIPIGHPLLQAPVTVGCFVFMANSVNLLDNMDGSAAGVAAIAASFVYVLAVGGASPDPALAGQAAVLAGAAAGFLVHNFPPASIFMGDAGSLVLGFALAGISIKLPGSQGRSFVGSLLAPCLVLALPVFDTALVWAARRAAHRPFFLGGRDHTTHRLVALGLSERRTVLVLYGAAALLGAAALAVSRGSLGTAVLTGLVVATALLLCGVFLVDVRVYKKIDTPSGRAMTGQTPTSEPSPWLFGAEVGLDGIVASAAWIAAYVVRFGDTDSLDDYLIGQNNGTCLKALPLVIALKLIALLSQDLYRGFWRSIHVSDLFRIAKATAAGTILVVAAAAITAHLKDYSRAVFALDAIFFFGGVVLSRTALRALRASVANLALEPRRAVLVGPRSLVALVLSGLARDGKPPCRIVAVVDPDAPEGLEQAEPAVFRRPPQEAGVVAETVKATVVVVAAPEPERAELTRALADRGLSVLGVSVSVE